MTAPTLVKHALNVDRGVALLDAKLDRDVWLPRVDLATLEVGSCNDCVLCQATGIRWYARAVAAIGVDLDAVWTSSESWTERHGFGLASFDNVARDFTGLQEAWRQRITQLRGEEDK